MLYDTYPCKVENVKLNQNEESYEIPGYDGARTSKYVPPGKLLRSHYKGVKTMIDVIERGCRISENGPCMGWRNSKSEYSWINYKEFMKKAVNFGSGLSNLGISVGQSYRVGIYAQNSIEWLVAEYGCFYYSLTVVPLYDTIGPDARAFMINNAESQVVVCDQEKKVKALLDQSEQTPVLKRIIHVNEVGDEIKQLGKTKGIELHLFADIEELGSSSLFPTNVAKSADDALICHTSGTTGNPKGAILTHENIVAGISGLIKIMGDQIPNKNDVSISYLPLAHVYEQLLAVYIFLHGASMGFFSGDISLLTDDIKVLQPTFFPTVPRVLNKLYDKVISQIKKQQSNLKENNQANGDLSKDIKEETPIIQKNVEEMNSLIYKSVLNSLGGKIRVIFSGAAPISENVLNFFKSALGCTIVEVYGQTECGGPCCTNIVTRETVGSVGAPLLCNMIKLEDVPELEYFKENRIGEVCIKGPNVFKGYLNDPEKTAESIDTNGWLHTGDVGMWLPNGTLKIVDRKQHIFKLAQGEYIMPEKIENFYLASSFVSQIFVHGDSLQSFLVAIVIPERSEILSWCKDNSISGTWNDICDNHIVKKHILEDIQRVGKISRLLSFQQVKDIYLYPEPLSIEAGHLTPTQKFKRVVVRKLFVKQIQAMYNKSY